MPSNIINGVDVPNAISAVLPIGVVLPWMSPTAGAPQPAPPSGWEYCDGTAVSTAGSPMIGMTKPSLMRTVAAPAAAKRTLRGADTTAVYGGATPLVTGGADTHTHGGSTDSQGNHSHNVSSHSHSVSSDGSHSHGGATSVVQQDVASGPSYQGGGFFHRHYISADGTHSHGGSTGNAAPSTDSQGNHSHNVGTSASGTLPAYAELAFIIRVL